MKVNEENELEEKVEGAREVLGEAMKNFERQYKATIIPQETDELFCDIDGKIAFAVACDIIELINTRLPIEIDVDATFRYEREEISCLLNIRLLGVQGEMKGEYNSLTELWSLHCK